MKREMSVAVVVSAFVIGVPPANAHDLSGVYGALDLTLETRNGERPSWVKLFKEQDVAGAEFVGTGGGKRRATEVKVNGVNFEWTIGNANYDATLADGKLTGHLVRGDRRTPLTGERMMRPIDVTGTWDVEINIGDRSMKRTLKLEQKDRKVTGLYGGGQLSERGLTGVTYDHGRLTYSIQIEIGGQQRTIDYDVQVQGDRLAGTVSVEGADRKGKIEATRQRAWDEPIELFVGKDLSNWGFQRVGGENQWKVIDGVMVNEKRGWNIVSEQKFKDYKLGVDVKVPPHGNSGIYLNGRYEVQVADTHGRGVSKGGMGAIYGRAVPTANPSKSANEWQTFEITFVDYWATVVLNGTTIVDNVLIQGITGGALDSHESEPGPIMLQGDHGHIEYRNVVVTPLSK